MVNLEVLPDLTAISRNAKFVWKVSLLNILTSLLKQNPKTLDLIHTDICDMKSTPSRGGKKYFITFIDDCTRFCYVYLLNSKDEAKLMHLSNTKIKWKTN